MLKQATIVFDLDGTLVDTAPDLSNALNDVMTRRGHAPVPAETVRACVGHGARVMIEQALRRAGASDLRVGVNLFGAQFHSVSLVDEVRAALADSGLPPSSLELEITETVVLANEDASVAELQILHNRGIGIAFDDFGTGYASLSLLEDFPLTRLKIDRSFVQKMTDKPDVPVIRAILQLAEGFGLDVVAEGIETEDQMRRLRRKGCSEGQGYLFGRPVPSETFSEQFISSAPAWRRLEPCPLR